MNSKIKQRIIARIGGKAVFRTLTVLPGTDLQSLLMEAYEERISRVTPSDIARQYAANRLLGICPVSQKELCEFDRLAHNLLPEEFESVELPPVTVIGINSVLTKVSQKTTLATIRNTEVVSDPTTVLAAECAKRRELKLRTNPKDDSLVRLSTSQRGLRLQRFAKETEFTPHFRAFALASAGRDIGHEIFEGLNLIEHLCFYLNLLESLQRSGYRAEEVEVNFSDIRIAETLIAKTGLNRREIGKHTQSTSFDMFDRGGVRLPVSVKNPEDIPHERTRDYGLAKYTEFLTMIKDKAVKRLREIYPHVTFGFDLHQIAGIGYYQTLCFKLTAKDKDGRIFSLADGGCADWTQKLLNSKKEKILVSGFGSELFCRFFKA